MRKITLASVALFLSAIAALTLAQVTTNPTVTGTPQPQTNVAITGGSINGTSIGATTPSTGAFTTLSASSTVSGTGFSTYLASPPAIGSGTPGTGNFTTLGTTGAANLGTAASPRAGISISGTTTASGGLGSAVAVGENATISASANSDEMAILGNYASNPAIFAVGAFTTTAVSAVYLRGDGMSKSGGATPATATTLKIENAPTIGTTNRSIWIKAGLFESAGGVTLTGLTTGTNADVLCLSSTGVVLIQAAASCTISSVRFKRDVEPLKVNALGKLAKLQPVAFNMKDGERPNPDNNYARRQIGFTAENIAQVDKRMAIFEQDGVTPKAYREGAVLALAVEAIKEQQKQIDALKREVRDMRSIRQVSFHRGERRQSTLALQ